MQRVHHETEHQELFHLGCDLRAPVAIAIPSALAPLGYHVCLRVPTALARELVASATLRTTVAVHGLRDFALDLAAGEGGVIGEAVLPSSAPGESWAIVCRAKVARGDGTLRFAGLPAGLERAHLLLCTWPRFIASGQADAWIACQRDPLWAPSGVALGGIGCGKVELSRDGRLRNFSGNDNQDMPFEEPDGLDGAFCAIALGGDERVLATRAAAGRLPVPRLTSELAFPQATLIADDAFPGIDARARFSGPTVPHDLDLAALPGFVLRVELRNRRSTAATVSVRMAWPNLVGQGGGIGEAESRVGYGDGFYRFWEAPAGHTCERAAVDGFAGLRYGNAPSGAEVNANADGEHLLLMRGSADEVAVDADPRRGSVARTVTIAAGASATVDVVVCWPMPHGVDLDGVERGHWWQRRHGDGLAVAGELAARCDEILTRGGELAALLARAGLPEWMRSRLANSCYPLVTNSVLYRDGRFSINEGPTEMGGCFGTIDQRLGAHPATQLLFPELNRRELEQFGAIQGPEGGIQHDLGHGTLERGPGETTWPDLTCSYILQTARHAWTTGDRAFEDAAWPRAKRALLRHAVWADAGGGVAQVGDGLGTSYDGYHYFGTTPYMATLWRASLLVCRRWALRRGGADAAELVPRIDAWLAAALARLEADLWNGRFYRAYGSATGPVNESCHAGMLAGEAYARLLAGEDVLPEARMRACADAIAAHNLHPRFACPPDEASADGATASPYSWLPYVECFGLAALAVRGDARAMPAWQRACAVVERGGAGVGDTRLMYRPLSGEPAWGAYYMTAPAAWMVHDAWTDAGYDAADRVLRAAPKQDGGFAIVHPLFWATGRRQGESIELTIDRVFSSTATSPIVVTAIETAAAIERLALGSAAATAGTAAGAYRRFAIPPLTLAPGTLLRWRGQLRASAAI